MLYIMERLTNAIVVAGKIGVGIQPLGASEACQIPDAMKSLDGRYHYAFVTTRTTTGGFVRVPMTVSWDCAPIGLRQRHIDSTFTCLHLSSTMFALGAADDLRTIAAAKQYCKHAYGIGACCTDLAYHRSMSSPKESFIWAVC